MIDFVNNSLQFEFVTSCYIPVLLRVFLATVIAFVLTIFLEGIFNHIKNKLLNKILFPIGILAVVFTCTLLILLAFMVFILPVLLTIIALKIYIMDINSGYNEFMCGLLSTFICFAVVTVIGLLALKD